MMNRNMLVILLGMTLLADGMTMNNRLEDEEKMDVERVLGAVRPVKRNLWQFGKMIKCATGRSALDYNKYGNWCGAGGSGNPVDGVDRCCKAHDSCYNNNNSCRPKWTIYDYSISGSYPSCTITCNTRNNQCKMNVCRCDKIAAECFARNTYNSCHKKKTWG